MAGTVGFQTKGIKRVEENKEMKKKKIKRVATKTNYSL